MAFQVASDQYGDVRFDRVDGERGAGHFRLVFKLQFAHYGRPNDGVRAIGPFECDVNVRLETGEEVRLGRAHQVNQQSLVFIRREAGSQSLDVGIELDHSRVGYLERARDGGGLVFRLTVSALAVGPEGPWRPLDSIVAEVNQSQWLVALSRMGYGEFQVLELPAFPGESNPAYAKAFDYLDEAHSHMQRGLYRDAVGKCRDVMEAVASALGEDDEWKKEAPRLFNNVSGADRVTRIRILRRAFWLLAAPAKHGDERSSAIEWTRSDAVMAVHIATVLLGRVSRGYLDEVGS